MSLPSTPLRPRPRLARAVALALLVLQGLVAVLPSFEPRPAAGAPVVHVEQQDAQHTDMHDDESCALCAARNVLAVRALPMAPLTSVSHAPLPAAAQEKVATPADARVGNLSRAPPVNA
ncbi:MAG: hypothetical protein Q8K55_01255 [Gemmatimonadaceae bacterium]|nr:hypothetical protein [Gemmatimonadaceae bacterium]